MILLYFWCVNYSWSFYCNA